MVPLYRVSTLLYAFDPDDRILLLERTREPNCGLWSPPGGKVEMQLGESPYAGACREALEELGLPLRPADLHLTGMISEAGCHGATHWLMFLFEVRPRLRHPPPDISEGRFAFHPLGALDPLPMPRTDREAIWPWFRAHRGGFFAAHCRGDADGRHHWSLEDSRPACSRP